MNEAVEVTVNNEVTWVDIATLATAAALVIGAFLAYGQTKRQIRQAVDHHKEQLNALLRPLVAVPHAESSYHFDGTIGNVALAAWLQNVGPGPALKVELIGWLRVPKATRASPETRPAEIEALKSQINLSQPEVRARVGALGSNSRPAPAPLVALPGASPRDYAGEQGVLLYTVFYEDVFENAFPRVSITGKDLGHIDFGGWGSWRERP